MRCPKCGHDNPQDTIFCEECDWRLDIPFRPEKKRNPLAFSAATLVLGVVGAVCAFLPQYIVALVCGALAMFVGGYSVNLPRLLGTGNRSLCMGLAGVGLILGVVGFILGFAGTLGALRWRSTAGSTSSRGWGPSAPPWSTTWTSPTASACPTATRSRARCAGGAATSPRSS